MDALMCSVCLAVTEIITILHKGVENAKGIREHYSTSLTEMHAL